MSHGDKKHIGKGSHGKGDGTGAMTTTPDEKVGQNQVLSNRDKAQHSKERGLDGNYIRNEQRQDHAGNRKVD